MSEKAISNMSEQEFESSLLENAVTNLSRLPGVGRKTALRLALHLIRQETGVGTALGQSIIDLCNGIRYCTVCHNISETDICPICSDSMRDNSTICVVETVKDVMSIERTGQYNGLYHVLGGVISPMDGIGPDSLEISSLIERIDRTEPEEIILALGSTMEGETTSFYIYRQIGTRNVKITQLARGLAVGNELEYTDELTLGRSLLNRTVFADTFKN